MSVYVPVLPEPAEHVRAEEAYGDHEHAGLEHQSKAGLAQLRIVNAARSQVSHTYLLTQGTQHALAFRRCRSQSCVKLTTLEIYLGA